MIFSIDICIIPKLFVLLPSVRNLKQLFMRKLFLIIVISSISTYGQDLISRQAPVDSKMKEADSSFLEKNIYKNDSIIISDKNTLPIIVDNKEGWEWIQNEENVFHDDSYPKKIQYHTYKSHPQYKVIFLDPFSINGKWNAYSVYNNNGTLIRVCILTDNSLYGDIYIREEIRDELLRQAYIKDYRDNKYNFKKENTKAQNYVKKELGLISDYVTLKNFIQTYSEIAVRYLDQLKKDHKNDFDNLIKYERINNLSFKLTFANNEGYPSKTYKVTYTSIGSFKYGITISNLPLEQINLSQYQWKNNADEDYYLSDNTTLQNRNKLALHKVKKGETINSIARKHQITIDALCKVNKIRKGIQLMPGQILKIPSGSDISSSNLDDKSINENIAVNTIEIEEESHSSSRETGKDYDNKVFDVVEEMPQFPGGPSALFEYISRSIQYPKEAEEIGVQGRVICTFVVEKNGSISDIKVINSVDPSLDKEAIRIINTMPNWIPGKKNGIPVRVKYTVPLTFRLQ